MPGTRTIKYSGDMILMETGQTTWNQGSVIARSTTQLQAGRLSTSNADEIIGVYFSALPANEASQFATDQLPELAHWGTGIPILVQASETIAANDFLTPSSVTAGTVRTAEDGEKRIGRAITAITVGAAANLVMAELYPLAQDTGAGAFGTASTGVVASEEVSGSFHKTTLTVSTVLPAIPAAAAQALGIPVYTLPAGVIQVTGSYMSMALTAVDGNIDADTPDGGLGTTIGSGANATLAAVGAGAENVLTGQTFNNCTGTAEVLSVTTNLAIGAADSHVLYFNVADTWAGAEAACPVAGTITVPWTQIA